MTKKILLGTTAVLSVGALTAVTVVSCGATKKAEAKKATDQKGSNKTQTNGGTNKKQPGQTTTPGNKGTTTGNKGTTGTNVTKKPSVKVRLTFNNKIEIIPEAKPAFEYNGTTFKTEQEAKDALQKDRDRFVASETAKIKEISLYEYKGNTFNTKAKVIEAVKKDIEEVKIKFNKLPQNTKHTYGAMKAFESTNKQAYVVDGKAYNTVDAAVVAYMTKNKIGDGSGRTYISKKYDAATKQFGKTGAINGKNIKEVQQVGAGDGKTYVTADLAVTKVDKYIPSDSDFMSSFLGSSAAGDVKFKTTAKDWDAAAKLVADHSNDLNKYKSEFVRILDQMNYWQEHRKEHDIVYALWIPNQNAKRMPSGKTWHKDGWYMCYASTGGTSLKYEVQHATSMQQLDEMWKYVKNWEWRFRQWNWWHTSQNDVTMSFNELRNYHSHGMDFRPAFKGYNQTELFNFERRYEYNGKWYRTRAEALFQAKKSVVAKEVGKTFDLSTMHKANVLTTATKKKNMLDKLRGFWNKVPSGDRNYGSHKTPWLYSMRFFGDNTKDKMKFSNVVEGIFRKFKSGHGVDRNDLGHNHVYMDELISYIESINDKETIDFVAKQMNKYVMVTDHTNQQWHIGPDLNANKVNGWAWGDYSGRTRMELLQEIIDANHITEVNWIDAKIKKNGSNISFASIISEWKKTKEIPHEYWEVNHNHFDTKAKAMAYAQKEMKKYRGNKNATLMNIDGAGRAPSGAVFGVNIAPIAGTGDKSGNTYKDVLVDEKDDKNIGNAKAILGRNRSKQEIITALTTIPEYSILQFANSTIKVIQYNSTKVKFNDGDSSKPVTDNEISGMKSGVVIKFKSDGATPNDNSIVILDNEDKDTEFENQVVDAHAKKVKKYIDKNSVLSPTKQPLIDTINKDADGQFNAKQLITKHAGTYTDKEVEITEGWNLYGLNGKARFMEFKTQIDVIYTYYIIRKGTTAKVKITKSPKDIKNGDKLILSIDNKGFVKEEETIVTGLKSKSQYDAVSITYDAIALY